MKSNPFVTFLKLLPMLTFVVVIYNLLAFTWPSFLSAQLFSIQLPSGTIWKFDMNHLFVCASILLLYIEIFKATRTSSASIIDHFFSMIVFIICLLEFILVSKVGNSTFFIIMLITLFDVLAGFTITISTARRDFGVTAPPGAQ